MNQKQKIFNLLAKTSKTQMSKSRNVKFSMADDLTRAYEEAESAASGVMMHIEIAYETIAEAIGNIPSPDSFLQDVDSASEKLKAVINEARSAAEQLGIDPRDIPGFSEADFAMESLVSATEAVARYEDEVTPLLRFGGL